MHPEEPQTTCQCFKHKIEPPYCTIPNSAVLTIPDNAAPYPTVPHHTRQYSTKPYSTPPNLTVRHPLSDSAAPYRTVLHHTGQCCTMIAAND